MYKIQHIYLLDSYQKIIVINLELNQTTVTKTKTIRTKAYFRDMKKLFNDQKI